MVLSCDICCHIPKETNFDWLTFTATLSSLILGVSAMVFSYFQFKRSLKAERVKEEKQEIYKKLNDFYGPFLQLRKKSKNLYDRFNKQFKELDNDFSALIHLLEGNKFSGNSKVLIEEIIEIGNKCEKLIYDKAGLIDDAKLRTDIIPKAATHYLILRLAYKGKLQGDIEEYKGSTFPMELDDLLEIRRQELESRLKELNSD